MLVACHQPNYLPWSGYFHKIRLADVFVILDSIQFPRGRSWVSRNRIKTSRGQLWLTVPVKRKGLGLQRIQDVEIDNNYMGCPPLDCGMLPMWGKKHLLSLVHFYKKAPYFSDYIDFFTNVYEKRWGRLSDLNLALIKEIKKWLEIDTKIVCSSELGIGDRHACPLLIEICKSLGADTYFSGSGGRKYIDDEKFKAQGINVKYFSFEPSAYPQFWGDFISNLSIVDLLFNCGKKGFANQVKSAKFRKCP